MRRGRPRYPDLLTPREQEVLALLREGLTNEQIALRLGISRYGAKYHVSEILSKLGVSSREEAAAWRPERDHRGRLPVLAWLGWKRIALAAGGVAVLSAGLVLSVLLFRDDSQDLGKVAFIRDGNLWVKTLPDGPELQLTSDGAAAIPRWSPSGEWLLYQKGPPASPEEIGARVIKEDGSFERRPDIAGLPSWAPDADILAFALEDSSLVLEHADGSGRRQLLPPISGRTANPLDRRMRPMWSSDGQWVVFEEHHADHTRAAAYTYVGIRAVRLDGSDEHELFSGTISAEGLAEGVMLAPWAMGGAPAYVSLGDAATAGPRDADGLPLHLLAFNAAAFRASDVTSNLAAQEGPGAKMLAYREYVVVSPDRTRLALVTGVAPADIGQVGVSNAVTDAQTNKAIALMDLRIGAIQTLTDSSLVAVSPAWSPEGKRIAFVARPDTGPVKPGNRTAEQARRLWTMASDGANARPLPIDGPDCRHERPQWSNDGEHLLFACVSPAREVSLWIVPSGGGVATEAVQGLSSTVLGADVMGPTHPAPLEYQGRIHWHLYYDWWQP